MTTDVVDPLKLYTLDEAGQLLGLSRSAIKAAIRTGDLASVKLGPTPKSPIRVRAVDLAAYVDARLVPATSARARLAGGA
jgi:hypothetical protein